MYCVAYIRTVILCAPHNHMQSEIVCQCGKVLTVSHSHYTHLSSSRSHAFSLLDTQTLGVTYELVETSMPVFSLVSCRSRDTGCVNDRDSVNTS